MTQIRTMKRTMVLLTVIMAALMALSTVAAPDAEAKKKKKKKASRVTTFATINGVDDETFGPDEFGTCSDTSQVRLSGSVSHTVMNMECKWGGELRVELDLNGQRLNNGDVNVSGVARLYEGTSEDNDDLDGQKNISILVPKGQTVNSQHRVDNTNEGGDFAEIDLSFSNTPVR